MTLAADFCRHFHVVRDLFEHALDAAPIDRRMEKHRELIAAEARDRVGAADRRFDGLREPHEHFVAGHMSVRIVDLLEAIDVEDAERAVIRAAGNGALERGEKRAAVHDPGQAVVQRHALLVACSLFRDLERGVLEHEPDHQHRNQQRGDHADQARYQYE